MAVVAIEHIDVDSAGVARISGSRTKIIQIVMDRMANNWSAEDIRDQYPHLSLAQIHATLAYYYDHQAELDAQIESDSQQAREMRDQAGPSPIAERLRVEGKLK
ncbi:MAG: DUF433 domain-containing protein [Planctomycetota bacterium]|jgi:uncharacterized protein (DUF433 family)|nr:DUF433 domain-containing protein [Planctomycetota bacterium]